MPLPASPLMFTVTPSPRATEGVKVTVTVLLVPAAKLDRQLLI
jgi:hypothetical protein